MHLFHRPTLGTRLPAAKPHSVVRSFRLSRPCTETRFRRSVTPNQRTTASIAIAALTFAGCVVLHQRIASASTLPPTAPKSFQEPQTPRMRLPGLRLATYERNTKDFLMWENVPGAHVNARGVDISINRWGMRDIDYPLVPAKGTYRIALLGSSMTFGPAVPVEQTMESVLETRLNQEESPRTGKKYEILDFSVGAYGILQNVAVADQKVSQFRPNAVLVGVFSVETPRMPQFLIGLIKSGNPIPYPYVRQKLKEAGVSPDMEEPELRRRLAPVTNDLLKWSYMQMVRYGREKRIPVYGVILAEPRGKAIRDIDKVAAIASSAGLPLLDLRDIYAGRDVDDLRIGGPDEEADPHWNATGHRLVANELYALMKRTPGLLPHGRKK